MTTLNFLTILLIFIFNICKLNSIRVCDNFESYLHPNDGHCFDNPDGESNVTQMIQRLGFTFEENYIYTKDGYRLLIVRTYYKITQDTPIVLGHAAAKNSESFVNRGNKSIVYYLGMKGYEIYLINFRGTIYSKSHRTLSTDDEKFWDFSFYEWGNYDISATLMLVQSKSEKKALYIGYSTATAASYIYATRKATETKENLKGIISLAPIAYLHNIKSAYKILIRISTIFRPLILLLTHGEIKKIPYLKQLCSYYPWQMYLCQAIKGHFLGFDFGQMDPTQMIQRWGFTAEEYYIYTDDGYQLLIIRAFSKITEKTPIILGHSDIQNSDVFANRGKKSLAYYLGDKGYEIYLINFRGCKYSRGHRTLTPQDSNFWNFSFYEWGVYDIPATLKLVQTKSNDRAVYIGFSDGTTASYVYATRRASEAKKCLKGIISLGPIVYLSSIKSAFKILLPLSAIFSPLVNLLLHGEFRKPPYSKELCSYYPWQMYLCAAYKGIFYGFDFDQMDPLDLPIMNDQNWDSHGIGMVTHFNQIYQTGRFEERDLGISRNYEAYGQSTPLPYNLTTIPVPVALFVGINDWITTPYNYRRLYSELNGNSKCGIYTIKNDKWNHLDFIEAKDIVNLLYQPLYEKIKEIVDGNCQE